MRPSCDKWGCWAVLGDKTIQQKWKWLLYCTLDFSVLLFLSENAKHFTIPRHTLVQSMCTWWGHTGSANSITSFWYTSYTMYIGQGTVLICAHPYADRAITATASTVLQHSSAATVIGPRTTHLPHCIQSHFIDLRLSFGYKLLLFFHG